MEEEEEEEAGPWEDCSKELQMRQETSLYVTVFVN